MMNSSRNRWIVLTLVRLAAAVAAVAGLVLFARAELMAVKLMAACWVLISLYVMAVVPLSLAHRWRTPPGE